MAEYDIKLNKDKMIDLLSRDDAMSDLLTSVLNQVLEAEMAEHLGADRHERTGERLGYRNGYRQRILTTRVGSLTLQVPQTRDGSFNTHLFKRYQRSEQAFVLGLMEMYLQGVSTRKVSAITEQLCGAEFSKSQVSQLCQELDQRLNEWRYRSLSSKQYPFILVDALVVDVRRDQAIRSSAVLIAYGVNENGQRETLDLAIDDSESETSWDRFFKQLKARGLTGVDFVVSDAHAGLVKAAKRNFQGSQWQRCQVHFQRNILGNARRQLRKEMAEHLQRIFTAKSSKVARELADEMIEEYERKAPKSMDILDEGLEHATTILQLPQRYHKRLRTTNLPERVNEEIRRRQKVIRIFPNDQAAIRLIGALLAEKNDEWLDAPQRYLNMNEYFDWKIDHSNKTTENTENNIIEML